MMDTRALVHNGLKPITTIFHAVGSMSAMTPWAAACAVTAVLWGILLGVLGEKVPVLRAGEVPFGTHPYVWPRGLKLRGRFNLTRVRGK